MNTLQNSLYSIYPCPPVGRRSWRCSRRRNNSKHNNNSDNWHRWHALGCLSSLSLSLPLSLSISHSLSLSLSYPVHVHSPSNCIKAFPLRTPFSHTQTHLPHTQRGLWRASSKGKRETVCVVVSLCVCVCLCWRVCVCLCVQTSSQSI